MNTIAPNDLAQLLPDNSVDLIDVREADEVQESKVDGSKWIPLGQITERAGEISKSRATVVMCRGGKRSEKAIEQLTGLGFTNLTNLEGGMLGWQEAGLPFVASKNAGGGLVGPKFSVERQTRVIQGAMVLTGFLVGKFVHASGFWLCGLIGLAMIVNSLANW